MRQAILALFLLVLAPQALPAQDPPPAGEEYLYPTDPLVGERLEEWRDLKFGLLMHWGLYAQLGIVESWALCSEDQPFQNRGGTPYVEFKEMYFGLIKDFNPAQFDPAPWATAARDAGMRYVVFTAKHHDGFSMWDTEKTEFRITGPDSPFRDHPKANVAKEVFDAFREEGFMTGAYFSKADWHHPDYWSPLWATPNRNNNYDTGKYPEKWQSFRDFTYDQVEELVTTLGPMDLLWLDAGWVRPDSTINDEVRSWGFDIARWEQDIDMPRIVEMARRHQPGLLVVDRTVHGPFEDYRTPEQTVPPETLPYPWEANLTMTQSWGHNFNPEYKSTEQLIHTLIDVVSKGGNFLLNVAPTPDGTLEEEAYSRLEEIGEWMKVNGEGIYATRPFSTFGEGEGLRFTRSRGADTLYVFALRWPGSVLRVESVTAREGSEVTLLGHGEPLEWSQADDGLRIELPPELRGVSDHAWTFRVNEVGPVSWSDPTVREHSAAMAAHHLCSGSFVVGRDYQRDPARVLEEDILPFPDFNWQEDFRYEVDREAKTASVWGSGTTRRTAAYNRDQGCSILPSGAEDVHFTPAPVPRDLPDPSTQPWPTGDVGAYGTFPEVDEARLDSALDWAMVQPQNTRALVILYRGKIIGERFAPGFTRNTPQISWSQGKSITAALVGVLVQQGKLTLDQAAPVPEWRGSGDPRNAIEIQHLMRMSSGLDFQNHGLGRPESWMKTNEHFRIYFDGINVFEHAIDQPVDLPPDSAFRYRNSDPLTLGRIVRQTVEAAGEDYLTFPQRALFDRIGARNFVLETDPWGNFIMTGYDFGSAWDWARFGLLHLWDGVWEGERILPEGWTDFVSTPAPGARRQEYGGLFWLNLNGGLSRVPLDAYWAAGYMGQTTLIIPSRGMVVVRLGPSPGGYDAYLNEVVGRVLESLEPSPDPVRN